MTVKGISWWWIWWWWRWWYLKGVVEYKRDDYRCMILSISFTLLRMASRGFTVRHHHIIESEVTESDDDMLLFHYSIRYLFYILNNALCSIAKWVCNDCLASFWCLLYHCNFYFYPCARPSKWCRLREQVSVGVARLIDVVHTSNRWSTILNYGNLNLTIEA